MGDTSTRLISPSRRPLPRQGADVVDDVPHLVFGEDVVERFHGSAGYAVSHEREEIGVPVQRRVDGQVGGQGVPCTHMGIGALTAGSDTNCPRWLRRSGRARVSNPPARWRCSPHPSSASGWRAVARFHSMHADRR